MDERIFGAVIGLARACSQEPVNDSTMSLIRNVLSELKIGGVAGDKAEQIITCLHKEKYTISPGCETCEARCGRTDDYIIGSSEDDTPEILLLKRKLADMAISLYEKLDNNILLDSLLCLSYYASEEYFCDKISALEKFLSE